MRWKTALGVLVGSLLTLTIPLAGQPFSVPIQQAIALLTSGTTPFEIVRLIEDGYINFDEGSEAAGYGFRDNAGTIQWKNDGGSWTSIPTSGLAPTDATYITQTLNATLTNEQALSALASALLVNTTTTGVLSAYAGSTCTNEVVTAFSALGVATCDPVTLTTMVTGTLPVANGGTGAATLTGILRGNGTSALTVITTDSTVGRVLRVTAADTYAFGALDLDDTDAVTGTTAVANGGTNLASGTSGGVLYYSAAGTLASSGALSANLLVLGGGAGSAPTSLTCASATTVLHGGTPPTCTQVNLATDTTGSIGPTTGGTGLSSYTTGDLIQATAANTLSALASVSAGSHLRSVGVATASVWSTTKWPNAATTGDVLYASGANTYANLADVAVGSYLRAGGVAAVPVWSTVTLPNAATIGDLIYASAANVYSNLTAVATGRVLGSAGVATAPVWLTNPSSSTFEVSTAFIGPGTEAAAGVLRLANTSLIAARNAGNTGDISLLTSTAADRISLGSANSTGLTYTDATRSLHWQTQAPTISSGFGTTPSIAGNASAFRVTVGGGGDTSGVVLFNVTWATAPVCMAQNQTTSQAVRPTPTTTQITLTGTLAAADLVAVSCIGF